MSLVRWNENFNYQIIVTSIRHEYFQTRILSDTNKIGEIDIVLNYITLFSISTVSRLQF